MSKEEDSYKKRLMRGESEKSAKSDLEGIIRKEGYIITNEGEKIPIRVTDKVCPKCNSLLLNTKLDGENFYCPECKKQYQV